MKLKKLIHHLYLYTKVGICMAASIILMVFVQTAKSIPMAIIAFGGYVYMVVNTIKGITIIATQE